MIYELDNKLKPFDSMHIDDNSVFDPKDSLFIEASAGTGKTYTIQQIVARLLKEETPINKILIVTYTEKAAGELKTRIREKLEEVLQTKELVKGNGKELTPNELNPFKVALEEIDSVQIFTIHSFCQKTLNSYAYDARRSFEMKLINDKSIKNVIAKWVRDHWPEINEYENLLGLNDDDENAEVQSTIRVIENIEKIVVNAIPKFFLNADGSVNEDIVSLASQDKAKILSEASNFEALKQDAEFNELIQKLEECSNDPWSTTSTYKFGDVLSELKKYDGKSLFNGSRFKVPNTDTNSLNFQLKNYKAKLKKAKDHHTSILINHFIYTQLPDLYRAWNAEKLQNKNESYQDMISAVHHAVMDDTCGLCQKLREIYQYAIIDEFQDTNQLQWDIFKKIFLNVPEHSIMVVGDPKQSIYSFQGADLNVYREAIQEIQNGRRLDHNYRSTDPMIRACNKLFSGEYFDQINIVFEDSHYPGKNLNPLMDGQETKPVWIVVSNNREKPEAAAEAAQKTPPSKGKSKKETKSNTADDNKSVDENEFARIAVEKIIECCSFDKTGQKTRLQVFDKKTPNKYRNVKFSDFAILARARSEFPPIENTLAKFGVPFLRYKDSNLFSGRECMEWIALFKAIDADDFSSRNRKLLNETLLTDFFTCPGAFSNGFAKLKAIDDDYYDDPLVPERTYLAKWHSLARRYRWAELQENIYRDTQIEKRLSDLSKLQEIAKLHQIGNYCIEYLSAQHCSIDALVKHLENLRKDSDNTDDPDGNLVAKGTDFDAVQLMTIHASKGLEFPVVISVCGFKMYNDHTDAPYLYHQESARPGDTPHKILKLGFDSDAKGNRKKEELEECRRLFYVAYTRASSLLILPKYEAWNSSKWNGTFLKTSIENFMKDENNDLFDELSLQNEDKQRENELKAWVTNTLKSYHPSNEQNDTAATRDDQLNAIFKLQRSVGNHCLIQHSYSSLAKKVKIVETPQSDEDILPIESAEATNSYRYGDQSESEEIHCIPDPNVDTNPKQIKLDNSYIIRTIETPKDFPAGTKLGNAIHEIFEKAAFDAFAEMSPNAERDELIQSSFMRYGMNLLQHKDWQTKATDIIQNTLNATLPEIQGNHGTGATFKLKDLRQNEYFAEVEFMLDGNLLDAETQLETTPKSIKTGEYFSKGYIDLMFVRTDSQGNKRYSILDWKTNKFPEDNCYAMPTKLKEKVDLEYAVQRVLYSYCLIEWLTKFYHQSPEKIFDDHFGGIYYAFVRGTAAETGNGIYAQTWDSYKELKHSYESIRKLMFSSKLEEKVHE